MATEPTAEDLAQYLGIGSSYDTDRLLAFTAAGWDWLIRALGRDFSSAVRTNEKHRGTGHRALVLKHYPVTLLSALSIDGTALVVTGANPAVEIVNENAGTIERVDGGIFEEGVGRPILVTYTGGPSTIPNEVWLAGLEAAAYLYQTTGGRGSVSGGGVSVSLMGADQGLRGLPAVKAALEQWEDMLTRKF